jgi:hypothetical protein
MKLAILSLVLLFSIAPLVMTIHTSMSYIDGVEKGYYGIRVDYQHGYIEFYQIYLGIPQFLSPYRISFFTLALIIVSTIIFCYSLILMVKTILKHKNKAYRSNVDQIFQLS